MAKKTFKDNTANIDRFFSEVTQETQTAQDAYNTSITDNTSITYEAHNVPITYIAPDTQDTYNTFHAQDVCDAQDTYEPYDTQNTHQTYETQSTQKTHYRINLSLRPEFRQYLDDEAWKARKSITQYINDLIAADMAAKQQEQRQ